MAVEDAPEAHRSPHIGTGHYPAHLFPRMLTRARMQSSAFPSDPPLIPLLSSYIGAYRGFPRVIQAIVAPGARLSGISTFNYAFFKP